MLDLLKELNIVIQLYFVTWLFCILQQLEKVAVSSANAKRFFEGVQGDSKQKGELFGVENMFSMRTGDRCLTEDILKVCHL